ncbi:MAG: ScpA family protein [Bdellovibrionales bacterium]
MSLQVSLERFEGPLGLLLHLIREQEMNIFDIDIATITRQYLEYIKTMRSLDLEVAGDFVAMAATLLQIKSRMLLPQYNEAGEEIEKEDPRRELVNRLLEYQKYQDASKRLSERPWVGRDVWLRGERLNMAQPQSDDIILEDNPLFSLITSYRKVVRAMKSGVHKVVGAMQSIAERILEMRERLMVGQKVEFSSLITAEGDKKQGQVLVTFLSLLELAKIGFVSLFQTENYGQIHIEAKKSIDGDVVSQVENYENVEAERMAEQILADSIDAEVQSEPVVGAVSVNADGEELLDAASDAEIEAEEQRLLDEEGGQREVDLV